RTPGPRRPWPGHHTLALGRHRHRGRDRLRHRGGPGLTVDGTSPQPDPTSHAPPTGPTNHPGAPVRRTLGPGPRKTPHPDQPAPFGAGLPGHGPPTRMGPTERGLHSLPDRDIDSCGGRRGHRPRPEPAPVGPDTPGLSFGRGHVHPPGPCVVAPRRSTGPGHLRPGGSTAVVAVIPALYLQPGNRLTVLTG